MHSGGCVVVGCVVVAVFIVVVVDVVMLGASIVFGPVRGCVRECSTWYMHVYKCMRVSVCS